MCHADDDEDGWPVLVRGDISAKNHAKCLEVSEIVLIFAAMKQNMKTRKNMEIFDVDAQLDAAFGKEGTPERQAAEERANAFFTGQIIEEARKNANITQEELAARIGTNKSYISLKQALYFIVLCTTLVVVSCGSGGQRV